MNKWHGIGVTRPLIATAGFSLLSFLALTTALPVNAFTPPTETPKPPPNSAPSGASRERLPCATKSNPPEYSAIQVLLPKNRVGYTAAKHPTFITYLPETTAREIVLTIRDAQKRTHSRTHAPISGNAGWVAITLPQDKRELIPNTSYQWFITVKCSEKLRAGSPFAEGWVKRVEVAPEIQTMLLQPASMEKAKVLGAASLWFDTASTLGQLRALNPQDPEVLESWKQLLNWTAFAKTKIDFLANLPTTISQTP